MCLTVYDLALLVRRTCSLWNVRIVSCWAHFAFATLLLSYLWGCPWCPILPNVAQCCPCPVSYNVPLTHSVTAAERPLGVEGDETKYAVPDLHTPTPLLLPPYWGQAGFFDTFKINLDVFKFPALFKRWNLKCWNKKSHFLDEICKTKCFNFGWWPFAGP